MHDTELLRRFLAARRDGDEAAMAASWQALVVASFDRVRGMVRGESRGLLSHAEQEDAVQRALERMLVGMMRTFRGTTIQELAAATRVLVRFACIDTMRREARHSRRTAPLEDAEDAPAPQEEPADGGFVAWAAPRLSEKLRAVLEADLEGVPVAEVEERLGITRDVVYQRRRRYLAELAKLHSEYEQP